MRGAPWIAGFALGQAVGAALGDSITAYLDSIERRGTLDWGRVRGGAMDWFAGLPVRFREECAGIAAGAGLPIERLAEWNYAEKCLSPGCSGVLCRINEHLWVARNNDYYSPELWGYATIREINGRIPTLTFGMRADPFTGTGINGNRLWLHYNNLPEAGDAALASGGERLDSFVWISEALETCSSLAEVEAMLERVGRVDSMLLFAVDGKSDEGAIFECRPSAFTRWPLDGAFLAGTNHALADQARPADGLSQRRRQRLIELTGDLLKAPQPVELPEGLVNILKDSGVERSGADFGTVFSNVVCPATGEVWYTFGGYPAPSQGAWARIPWPFQAES